MELEKAKKLIKSRYLLDVDTVEQKARLLCSDILATGEVGFSYRYLDGIASVTATQVMEVGRKYLRQDQLCVTAIVPTGEGAAGTGAKGERAAKGRSVERSVLDNGLRLLTQEGDATSTVSIDAYFLGGR